MTANRLLISAKISGNPRFFCWDFFFSPFIYRVSGLPFIVSWRPVLFCFDENMASSCAFVSSSTKRSTTRYFFEFLVKEGVTAMVEAKHVCSYRMCAFILVSWKLICTLCLCWTSREDFMITLWHFVGIFRHISLTTKLRDSPKKIKQKLFSKRESYQV